MPDAWNAAHYLKFGNERTRAAAELAARIFVDSPTKIADLGCGPGNSTRVLRERWAAADVVGIDNSPEMIAAAKENHPDLRFETGDVGDWSGSDTYDIVFANAVFHWVPDHAGLLQRIMSRVVEGGALAFQIPAGRDAPFRRHIRELSHDPAWNDRMEAARSKVTVHDPTFYYDTLAPLASNVDIWIAEYQHVMPDAKAILNWISSTAVRPYVNSLADQEEKQRFLDLLGERVRESYPTRTDGKVLFPFERLFVVAYR